MSTRDTAIQTEGLSLDLNGERLVDDVSLEIERGSIFGLLGPNGAGKTSTIRLLLGLLKPTGGRAEVLGFDTRRDGSEIRARSGVLFDHSGLCERLTASDVLEFAGRCWHMPADERRARAEELLRELELWHRRDEPVGEWSRGMKQRLAFARAVFHGPELVFLDEPTSGLDPVASHALRRQLVALAGAGVTIFLSTHDISVAERICDRVGVLYGGRLLACASPSELGDHGGSVRLRVGGGGFPPRLLNHVQRHRGVSSVVRENGHLSVRVDAESSVPSLVRLLVESGVSVEEVTRIRPRLEDAFLQYVQRGDGSGANGSAPGRETDSEAVGARA